MKVYLDTNIISGWINQDIPPEELEALERILEAWQGNRIELCTSQETGREIDRTPEEHRAKHVRVYKLIRLVPFARPVGTRLMPTGTPGPRPDPTYVKLKTILDQDDARHVFQAVKNGVNTFLTVDGGILAKKDHIQKLGMEVRKPSELVSVL